MSRPTGSRGDVAHKQQRLREPSADPLFIAAGMIAAAALAWLAQQ